MALISKGPYTKKRYFRTKVRNSARSFIERKVQLPGLSGKPGAQCLMALFRSANNDKLPATIVTPITGLTSLPRGKELLVRIDFINHEPSPPMRKTIYMGSIKTT